MPATPTYIKEGKHLGKEETLPDCTPGVLRIYSMKYCPFAQRTRLVASHKNIPHEIVNINLKSKPDWFLERNPKGTTPTIELDGQVLFDSAITSDFLDELIQENALHPKDPLLKAQHRVLLDKCGGKLFGYYALLFDQDPAKVEEKRKDITEGFDLLEANLQKSAFLGGESPAMVDFMVWPVVEKLIASSMRKVTVIQDIVKFEKHPNVAKWVKSMQEFPTCKATEVPMEKMSVFLEGYGAGNPIYDL